jgi:methylenetetrahydrofolate dehydrogenase (NADP+)/methenyltetrahydrofolate cyclohydrolase
MKILNGKKIGQAILQDLKKKIAKEKIKPSLGVVLVGNDKASKIYVGLKKKAAGEIGMKFKLMKFSDKTEEKEIRKAIEKLNKDENVHGIIVQMPLPKHLNSKRIIKSINPKKDVDGFHKKNIQLFLSGEESFAPVFPGAIMKLIEKSGKNLKNAKALAVVNSKEFGEMMVAVLKRKGAKAEYVLRKDLKNNLKKIKKANVLISACGIPGLINGIMVKNGAVVIDGGIAKVGKKTLGDVDSKSTKKLSGFISPVPGGVGPVTVAMLLQNTYEAMKKSR